jgi:predicted phosphodiesterase
MTRLALLADIHGNLPALDAVIADLAQFDVDHVVVAGDVINWGPFNREVVDRVSDLRWAVVRGNNEFYLLDANSPRQPAHWRDFTMLPWLTDQLRGRWHTQIAAWPDTLRLLFPDAPPLRIVHGSPRSPWEGIFPGSTEAEVAPMLVGVDREIVIAAHTHLPMDRVFGAVRVLNPGSVGVPLDGVFGARYALLDGDRDGWRATFRHVPVDLDPLFEAFEHAEFVQRCGPVGRLVIDEFRTARLRVHPFNMWRAEHHPHAPVTDELIDQFENVDPWPYTLLQYQINRELLPLR